PEIDTFYVQATARETESDLISQIATRSVLTGKEPIPGEDIVEVFTRLRRDRNQRTVIFIDQFEQWLFANPDCTRAPLTDALRQCDGDYLQCVLMVRDDFWMGVTRLMQTLDLPIAEDLNVTSVDLFDRRHARQVLALFGAAHGRLPSNAGELSPANQQFLDAAVDYLAKDGRVICVQLALLTEMLKGRTWESTGGIFDDGGADLGMRFFDETFDSESAPRRIRMHAEGSRRVLRCLLPELGSPIKGALRTEQELFDASGYIDRETFRQLVSLLDRELHLITPTDRGDDASTASSGSDSAVSSHSTTGYQLTHDFLITPIRQWIDYHSQATPQGQAKIRLDQFTELYRLHPRRQSLPTMSEYFWIRKNLKSERLNEPQQEMMSAAQTLHGRSIRNGILIAAACMFALLATVFGFNRYKNQLRDQSAFDGFLVASMPDAAALSNSMRDDASARMAATEMLEDESVPETKRLRATLLLPQQTQANELLSQYFLSASPENLVEVITTLDQSFESLAELAAGVWSDPATDTPTKIRAACLMARDPAAATALCESSSLAELSDLLLLENPIRIPSWRVAFEPIAENLTTELASRMRRPDRQPGTLNLVNLLAEYAKEKKPLLAELIRYAHPPELFVLADAVGADSIEAVRDQWVVQQADPAFDPRYPWSSPWWHASRQPKIDADWEALPPEFLPLLNDCETAIGEVTMLSHRVAVDEMKSLVSRLKPHGFRVASCMPYVQANETFAQVIWCRDSLESSCRWGLSAEELTEAHQSHAGDGWIPDDVTAYEIGEECRYACVWIRGDALAIEQSGMYVDVHETQHAEEGWKPLFDRGIWMNRSSLQTLELDGGYLTSVRWRPSSRVVGFQDQWDLTSKTFTAMHTNCRRAALLNRRHRKGLAEDSPTLAALWWENVAIESRLLEDQPRREHLRAAQLLLKEGFRPVSIDNDSEEPGESPRFSSIWWKWTPDVQARVRRAKGRANLAFTLLRLGDDSGLEQSMLALEDAELRGASLAGFKKLNIPCQWLVSHVFGTDDVALKKACARALALCRNNQASGSVQPELSQRLPEAYQKASDSGLRSALEAVATAWDIPLQPPTATNDEILSVVGHRLAIIRPTRPTWMGSPYGEPGRDQFKERLRAVTIDRSYAIATKAVTIEEYLEFDPNYSYSTDYADDVHCPAVSVSWYDAARYCRWLSEKEGLSKPEMCYPPVEDIGDGMLLDDDFLDHIGYRLPTEAEWEYACRGGSEGGRWFGFDPDRLDEHAWTTRNSGYRLHPVGQLLPNDYGLFDMLGNAMDLCHTVYDDRREEEYFLLEPRLDDGRDSTFFNDGTTICNRGGAMLYQPKDARASQREFHGTKSKKVYLSFRIARTVRE
ncbi:MAG: SUMF1/EgtB/PvdO family nonheme iron enzyme, partial [Planctomycetota bacterium]